MSAVHLNLKFTYNTVHVNFKFILVRTTIKLYKTVGIPGCTCILFCQTEEVLLSKFVKHSSFNNVEMLQPLQTGTRII